MRLKTFVPLIFGLVVGFLAVKMGVDMVRRAQAGQGAAVGVVVAATSIEPTTALTEKSLSLRQVAASLVPQGAFVNPKQLVGRVSNVLIPPGMVIDRRMLAPPGAQPGLPSRIPDGYRAVSVKVDEASSVAGFITPGSRVDVSALFVERSEDGRRPQTVSRIILRNIEVGAVGQSLNTVGPDGKPAKLSRSVTLLLQPDNVPTLQLAATNGRIQLALRNGRDAESEAAAEAGRRVREWWASLFRPSDAAEGKRAPAVADASASPKPDAALADRGTVKTDDAKSRPPVPPRVVYVYRGEKMERIEFNGDSGRRHDGQRPAAEGQKADQAPGIDDEIPTTDTEVSE